MSDEITELRLRFHDVVASEDELRAVIGQPLRRATDVEPEYAQGKTRYNLRHKPGSSNLMHLDAVNCGTSVRKQAMSSHLPPVPPANQSPKGPRSPETPDKDPTTGKHAEPENIAEQGETANIRQNTTNKGSFRGRRMK